jgi:hypothetical protein
MQALTLESVKSAFDPIDRAELTLPNLEGVIWEERDYFAWKDPGGF